MLSGGKQRMRSTGETPASSPGLNLIEYLEGIPVQRAQTIQPIRTKRRYQNILEVAYS